MIYGLYGEPVYDSSYGSVSRIIKIVKLHNYIIIYKA